MPVVWTNFPQGPAKMQPIVPRVTNTSKRTSFHIKCWPKGQASNLITYLGTYWDTIPGK